MNKLYVCKHHLSNIWLEGCHVNGGTLPPDVALTGSRPDLTIIDRRCNPARVTLLELTVTWDKVSNFDSACARKKERYEYLTLDIEGRGFKRDNLPLEIGCRGVINQRNRNTIFVICQTFNIKYGKSLLKTIGKVALLGSYQIWLARKTEEWSPGGLLK